MIDLKRYPSKGALTPQKGLNLTDNLFETGSADAVQLKNMVFVRKTSVQRRPFRNFSDTEFAPFFGAHDYMPEGDSARLLFYTDGDIKEIDGAVETDRVTGLVDDIEGFFTTAFDAAFFVNGEDDMRVGRGDDWRIAGSPVKVTDLAITAAGGGSLAAGTYLYVVIPVIDVSGVARVFANWSNIFKITNTMNDRNTLTWTDVADDRVTRYLIFRTEANGTDLRSLAEVNPGVETFLDTGASALPVVISGGPDRPPPLNSWGPPPKGQLVRYSGNRLVLGRLEEAENAIITSRVSGSSYDCEGFPDAAPTTPGSTFVALPKGGPVTAMFPIGETGEQSTRSIGLFVSQETACYILPETNPDLPLIEISAEVGAISARAIAQDGNFLFFQSRRGVEFWPGQGQNVYLISERIQPVFEGGGNQFLTANQGDANIRYCVAKEQLWITVRDDTTGAYPNKVYCLDLDEFRQAFPSKGVSAARFSGPIMNTGLSFGLMLRRLDGGLLNFDSLNGRILSYGTGDQDQVDGVNTNIPVLIRSGALLREDGIIQKVLKYAHILGFTGSPVKLTLDFEFGKTVLLYDSGVQVNSYPLDWEDIPWDDIDWGSEAWYQELPLGYSEASGKWMVAQIEKSDARADFAFFGFIFWAWFFKQIVTLK